MVALAVPLALGACADSPTAPATVPPSGVEAARIPVKGTGLVLHSLTDVTLPVLGLPLTELVIDQVVINDLRVVEDALGAIIGIEASGTITGVMVDALGSTVVEQDFVTGVGVISSGPGQCDVVAIDLGLIDLDALGLVQVEAPPAELRARGSGAIGSLLCNLGQVLSGLGGAIPGLVNGINNQI